MDAHVGGQDTSTTPRPYLCGSVLPSCFTSTAKATGSREMRVIAMREGHRSVPRGTHRTGEGIQAKKPKNKQQGRR